MVHPIQPQNKSGHQRVSDRSGNFFYLFAGLLLMLLTVPYVARLPGVGRSSLTLIFNTFMLIAVWSLVGTRHIFYMGLSLALAVSVISSLGILGITNWALEFAGLFFMLIFAGISAWIAGRHVFVLHRVDLNSLVGAFCVYLLIGFTWAIVFRLLQLLGLATFSGLIVTEEPFSQLIYFSFVTLASLGYGDITPGSGLARVLSYFEALVGQFYLAVLVACLVGAFVSQYRSSE
ncbi:MAG: hypothetical protein BVN35_11365 [Proteobacteria bacterium ST_bin11]|nr:MAG: hypothetical protein BVN35_11365 [Proteobacteria bacterium ST_bin11]